MFLNTILGFFLLSSLFHLVTVFLPGNSFISLKRMLWSHLPVCRMLQGPLLPAISVPFPCVMVKPPPIQTHGSLFAVFVPAFRNWAWDVARRGSVHWQNPVTMMCWEEGMMKRCYGVGSPCSTSGIVQKFLWRILCLRLLLLNECIFHCFRINLLKALPWTLEPIMTTHYLQIHILECKSWLA